jgi:4-hydroxybenzoate polyprenyltransferase
MRFLAGAAARIVTLGRAIKFSHSLFALPFALSSAAIAAREGSRPAQWLWILVAMVGARSAAMGFNRLADHELDGRNPRTASRELPRGALTRGQVWLLVISASLAFVVAAGMLNTLCLLLSPVALAVVLGYSYTKRTTSLSHVVLGLALAIAPVGAWLAIRGAFAPTPLLIAAAVVAWVAGFDVIYACQDVEFDRAHGLYSVPARLGIGPALGVARGLHVAAVTALGAVPLTAALHPVYFVGLGLVAALLVYEHTLVRADDLSRLDAAFFTMNGWVSVVFLATTLAAVWLGGRA